MEQLKKDKRGTLIDPSLRTVTLVPDSGIQFLDFVLDTEKARRSGVRFYVDASENLHPMVPVDDPDSDQYTSMMSAGNAAQAQSVAEDDEGLFSVSVNRALDTFARTWLPIPFLRQFDNSAGYDDGPTNWARAYIAPADSEQDNSRVVLAFDTSLVARDPGREYAAPDQDDVTLPNVSFSLVDDPANCMEYVRKSWIRDWVEHAYISVRGPAEQKGEPWAMYVSLVNAIARGCNVPDIEFVDIYTSRAFGNDLHVDVDLVLDIGNSRTCGILVEEGPTDSEIGLGPPPVPLEIRDLGRPERVYDEPFESRVEFHGAEFGLSLFARQSGRAGQSAFWWPSPVRTGPEALRLMSQSDGREGVSGMSSPKRYVWDETARAQSWINSRGERDLERSLPPIGGPIASRLTAKGTIRRLGDPPDVEQKYSRSNVYRLLICELLCHAIVQINSVASRTMRANKDLPRRLRSIYVTLPSATPVAEQKLMQRRVKEAVELVWQVLDWKDDELHKKPVLRMDWDEATCTHLVYLYNELEHRLKKFPKVLFDIFSRGRIRNERPALRIASIDIGGGTTDLMVIQHELEGDQIIHPNQMFREGWRQAGDDLLKKVVEDCVLPCLSKHLSDYGVSLPDQLVSRLFSGDAVGVTRLQQVRRVLFVNQILIPAALYLLRTWEAESLTGNKDSVRATLGEVLSAQEYNEQVQHYIADAIEQNGENPFDLNECEIVMNPEDLEAATSEVLGSALIAICDVVRAYECDILLLTGRPSALPAIRRIVESQAPVTPNRIVSMYGYKVGSWYPFRSDDLKIRDPKTTAAVGALLCNLCEGRRMSFLMRSSELSMKSTARFIGKMEPNSDQILSDKVSLKNIDLDDSAEQSSFEVEMEANFFLGYRQLPIERWVTSHLYHVFYKRPKDVASMRFPLRLTIERVRSVQGDEGIDQEALEDFKIVDVQDARGNNWRSSVDMRLQTFKTESESEAGYWLDSGSLQTRTVLASGARHGR